jgi:hypothetical protein
MNYKLGRNKAVFDKRALKLEKYLAPTLIPPTSINWWAKIGNNPYQMFLNDSLGICTCAAAAHYIMNWTANSSTLITPTNDDVLRAYEAITGYTPNNPATDNGAVELEVLKYWQTTGIANHKIGATTWQYTTGNIIGGHAIPSFSFSENTFEYITWGAVQSATYDWVTNRTEEAYALISQDWINNTGLSPSGFNMDQLVADLIQVQN